MYDFISFLLAIVAWGLPLTMFLRSPRSTAYDIDRLKVVYYSGMAGAVAFLFQCLSISKEVHERSIEALLDTIDGLIIIYSIFILGLIVINYFLIHRKTL